MMSPLSLVYRAPITACAYGSVRSPGLIPNCWPYFWTIPFQVLSMNWYRPVALDVLALIVGLKPDSCPAIAIM